MLLRTGLVAAALASVSPLAVANIVPTAIALGGQHSCALTTDGGVKCWGYDLNGQLGDNGTLNQFTPVDVVGLASGMAAIAAGENHSCAVTDNGGMKCWGRNFQGQLGNGGSLFDIQSTPVDVVGLGSGVVAAAAGGDHTCALTAGGGVKCWGLNSNGQLGVDFGVPGLTPGDVVGLASGVAAIAAGGSHTCALTTAGGVKCWGANLYGQLGDDTTTQRRNPVDVVGLASGVAAIAAGGSHTCALTTTGAVKCWGRNWAGQLGDDSVTNRRVPVDVAGLASGTAAIAAGFAHTCALTAGGGVKCWGNNGSGQLGDGAGYDTHMTPNDVAGLTSGIAAIAAGANHACARATAGDLRCWGDNNAGGLGDGLGGFSVKAVRVVGMTNGVSVIATHFGHSCVVTRAGGVKCWGYNANGQLGDNTITLRKVPVDVVGLASDAAAIAAGFAHTCALSTGGGMKCWGANFNGQLGDGYGFTDTHVPGDFVEGLDVGVAAMAVGAYHTCALTTGGGVKCWGANYDGQLGDGLFPNRFTPGDVTGLTSGVTAVAAGGVHNCALTTGGGVKCWGNNTYGQLGDNSTTNRTLPVDVVGLSSGVVAIAMGEIHSCALTTAGGVKCWGLNNFGTLGDGTSGNNRLVPVDVVGLASGVTAITGGAEHTCALVAGGAMQCWGANHAGALGDDTFGETPYPPGAVTGMASGVLAMAAGGLHTCALVAGGAVKCWGYNRGGQVGDNTIENKYVPVDVFGLKSVQSIAFAPPASGSVGIPVNLAASATSGLATAFDSWTPTTCTVSGTTVTPTAAGLCGVRASQTGDAGYFPAPQQLRLIVVSTQTNPAFPDFNADGKPDIIWSNTANGATYVWRMNGPALLSDSFYATIDPSWKIQGVADFNGDGHPDIVWRNTANGACFVWYTVNGVFTGTDAFLFSLPPEWVIQGVADFNGDGHPDFLMRNVVSGNAFAWFFNDNVAIGDQFFFNVDPRGR
ncbi:MAG: VCBS repeat-containing protein [Betaproteobacteria bacterium]|nr:VCBS repeat-containing protein [Betaproteobacteria bacterium]